MLNLFKKNTGLDITSPVNGKSIAIENVNDAMFSQKMLGDGIAVIPNNNSFVAPCDGVITAFFPSLHAYGITATNGCEILVHIGLETVAENGKGFQATKKQGDKVSRGETILTIDLEDLRTKYDMTTMIVVTNLNNKTISDKNINNEVTTNDVLFNLK